MVTEVKLEGLQVLTNAQSIQQHKKKAETVATNNGDVTVSNQLSSVISSLSIDTETTSEAERVRAAQQSIQNGQYRIDVDQLAQKLYHQLIPTKTGTF